MSCSFILQSMSYRQGIAFYKKFCQRKYILSKQLRDVLHCIMNDAGIDECDISNNPFHLKGFVFNFSFTEVVFIYMYSSKLNISVNEFMVMPITKHMLYYAPICRFFIQHEKDEKYTDHYRNDHEDTTVVSCIKFLMK